MIHFAAMATADSLLKSAYEIARDERIKANRDVLRQLGLLTESAASNVPVESTSTKTKPTSTTVKRTVNRVPTSPIRQSKRLKGETAECKPFDHDSSTPTLPPLRPATREYDSDFSKYEKLAKLHALEWDEETMGKLPQTATYEHTVMRVRTMNPQALRTRVKVIEKARGKFCVTKMQQFAEVLILEGMEDIAEEAKAALHRLLNGIAPPQ